jgi:hypothetical protein
MKLRLKVLAVSAMIAAPMLMAVDAPTIYGRINKEIRNVKQRKEANKGATTHLRDVAGAESTIGAKGVVPFDTGTEARYTIELGLNSNRDAGSNSGTTGTIYENGERIRIRQARIDLINSWGAVSLGQTWALDALRQHNLDPLQNTGAQLLGLESSDVTGWVAGMYGLRTRYLVDAIQYRIEYNGIGLGLSYDNDNSVDNLTINTDGARQKWTTAMLTFDRDFNGLMVNAHAVYAMGDYESNARTVVNQPSLKSDKDYWTVGSKFSFSDAAISFAYSKSNEGEYDADTTAAIVTPKDKDRKHFLVTGSYKFATKWTAAVTYGKTTFEDTEVITSSDAASTFTGGSQNQIAAGIIHECSSNVKSRLIYATQKQHAGIGDITSASNSLFQIPHRHLLLV